jgi:FkbM family methyltransferase
VRPGKGVTEKIANLAWSLGIRVFRMTRNANFSTRLVPALVRLAALVPATNHPTMATLPRGLTLWMPPGYRDTRTVVTGLFQQDETKLFERLVVPGTTVVDAGAYVGYFTVLSAALIGTRGRVYAFEPDSLAYDYLLRNITSNRCSNTIAINKAVSDRAGRLSMVRDPVGPESFVTTRLPDGQAMVVEAVTMDSFFETQNWPAVDIVKMNIEGSELFALRGMRELSLRNRALQVVMEFNPMAMTRAGVRREDLSGTLSQLGFRRAHVVERGLKLIPRGELLPTGSTVYNILLTK